MQAPHQLSVRLSVLTAAVCAVFLFVGGPEVEAGPLPGPPVAYVVEPGDTMWEIAARNATPSVDLRGLIADIEVLNDIDAGYIVPGQRLLIPGG